MRARYPRFPNYPTKEGVRAPGNSLQKLLPAVRSIVKRTIVFVSFALLAAVAAVRAGAAPMASGIQYDEINRMLPANATAPPAGSFGADAASIESPAPDPKKKRGLIGALMSGQLIEPNSASLNPFADLLQGRLERYSYYNTWERVDDVLAKTATIRKCDLHQLIELDLDKKTYRIVDTTPKSDSAPSPAPAPPHHAAAAEPAPGSGILDVTRAVRALGAVLIDGLTAQHFASTNTIALTQATGSCRDGTYAVSRDEYVSGFAQPHAICPVDFHAPAPAYPRAPEQMVARGGCRPTVTAHVSGPPEPVDKLALYSLMTLSGSSAAQSRGQAPSFSFLTERGNVRALSAVDRALFDIPSDYTKVP